MPILLFAKLPVAGRVKTRLAVCLGAERAAIWAGAMLQDSWERFHAPVVRGPVWLCGNREAAEDFSPWLPDPSPYVWQGEGHLGQRLRRVFARVFETGHRGAIAVGADTPHLPLERLRQASDAVRAGELTLGPTTDGGYYLIGLPVGIPGWERLFEADDWGSSRVLQRTRRSARSLAVVIRELESFWDIDDENDLIQWDREQPSEASVSGGVSPPPRRCLALLRERGGGGFRSSDSPERSK